MDASEAYAAPSRNKGLSRCYYFFILVVFLVLFLDNIVSLGSFGVIQAKLSGSGDRCILFGVRPDEHNFILNKLGVCAFILWGQVSIIIVAFVWLIYSSVLLYLGTNV